MLTPRWYPLKPHPEQIRLINSPARFKVVPAGRRSGKTERAKRFIILKAIEGSDFLTPRYFCAAPTFNQAKKIFWEDLKAMIPKYWLAKRPSETELTIKLVTGSEICVVGLDRPERIEGPPWDGGIIDEIGNCRPDAWKKNIRPVFSDRDGWAWLIGVPEGMNHYYDLAEEAKIKPNWDLFHWISADILSSEEIEEAKSDLDELSYKQEYEASFITFQGLVYYCFSAVKNVKNVKELYQTRKDIHVCFDFNVEPGVCSIIQEHEIGSCNIGEIYIPLHSNTPLVCRKFLADWGTHQGNVCIYGDATGGNRGSAQVSGSDWDLIRNTLRPVFQNRLRFQVPMKNPGERVRVNAMNSRICNTKGECRFFIDPSCKHLIKDFGSVKVLKGSAGEIDKKSDLTLTHISDAVGYYVDYRYPVVSRSTKRKTMNF